MARIFVTGGSGFTGPYVVKALISHGHIVVGLCRTQEKAQKMRQMGAEVVMGDLSSLDVLKGQAEKCDGVIHMAFSLGANFDFAKGAEIDKAAIEAMLSAMEGTGKAFINTGGTLSCSIPLGTEPRDETYVGTASPPPLGLRAQNSAVALTYKDKGIKSMLVRLSPTVHGEGDVGFIPSWMKIAKAIGAVPYFDEGKNIWTAVNKADTGELFALAYENAEGGAIWHGVAENLTHKEIAEAIALKLGLKTISTTAEAASSSMGVFAVLLGINAPAKADITASKLGWKPTHQGLLEDIREFY